MDVTASKSRPISTQSEWNLDAPGITDDFYLNLLSWSCLNAVAFALGRSTYIRDADTGPVVRVGEPLVASYVSSLAFSSDGKILAIGTGNGTVQVWDVETLKLRTTSTLQGRVASLSWNKDMLSSGCSDGTIRHQDVRDKPPDQKQKTTENPAHSEEVCGLEWRMDGELLASGGNDNMVKIWDTRVLTKVNGKEASPVCTKKAHKAAVKAIAWCPWQPSLLASGGGTNDGIINIWQLPDAKCLHSLNTGSQVTSIRWAPHRNELLSTHGYSTNSIMVHAYPGLELVAKIEHAHTSRVLFSAVSPSGDVVCTGSGGTRLKFWNVWEGAKE